MAGKTSVITLILLCYGISAAESRKSIFEVVSGSDGPVLKKTDKGTEDNKYGFEGGKAFKINGVYHLFTAEMIGDPLWVKMRLAYWKSNDGLSWKRVCTLLQSGGDFTGSDPRAAFWAPYPVYNEQENRWNLFYVSYRCKPNTEDAWYNNYDGRIWRAVSENPGMEGLEGPYKDVAVVLEPGPDSDPWEGLQGVAGFYPYNVDRNWYAFHGSAQSQNWPCSFWGVGLAKAEKLSGPWERLPDLSPVPLDKVWAENPIVTKLENGIYAAVFDGGPRDSFAYTISKDGINWTEGVTVNLQPKIKKWWHKMRTPLGLIPEGNNTFTVFYTAMNRPFRTKDTYGCIGMVKLRLKSNPAK